MTRNEFDNQITPLLVANWAKRAGELNPEQILIWNNALYRFPVGAVVVAIRTYAERARFFPAPCDISKICREQLPASETRPEDRTDYGAMEKLRLEIAQEAAEDAVTLSTVSVAEFAWHLQECVRDDPRLSHITSKYSKLLEIHGADSKLVADELEALSGNRMAQVFVCDSIEAGRVAPQHERNG